MSAKQKYQKITEDWASRAQDANYSDFTLSFMLTVGDVESYDKMIGQKRARSEVDDMVDAAEPLKKKTKRKTITFHCDDRRKKDKGYLPFPLIVDNIKSTNNSLTVRQCRAYCAVLGLGCRNGSRDYHTKVLLEHATKNAPVGAEGTAAGLARPATPPGGGTWFDWSVAK